MLDTATKRRIDTARDILVGKVPDPKSQVEQITIALIYKFMDDMDAESEEIGGKRTFFTAKFSKYGWRKIFDPKLSGFDMLNLYSEAIQQMNLIPTIPQLFRDIFKNAYLPYRDPETLKAFLKIINEFSYDHSEKLGDAFEYLLSVLGSQGDAGQFRTPRHIIDFMVRVTDPKKNEKILDPACGTAGFLISSYKHILLQNSKGGVTGRALTNDDRKKLATNFRGYDISPDMVRLSLANMYLHGFTQPQIYEYDTLTSEERWNEYYDVIMANPPFMSPKGGIKPHKRFSVKANRSEVLFVDYIAEHLTPIGRAAIIVPEGIIFQSGTAYKQLRKLLVEQYLYAVVSLPAGVFNPYSGVKTSVLLIDKAIAKKSDSILFVKIQNDGFDLGAQRRAIDKSDLYFAEELLKHYRQHAGLIGFAEKEAKRLATVQNKKDHEANDEIPLVKIEAAQYLHIPKEKIAANGEYNFSGDRYKENVSLLNHEYPIIELGNEDYFKIESGGTPSSTVDEYWNGNIKWATLVDLPPDNFITEIIETQRMITEAGLKNSSAKLIEAESVIVSTRATIGRIAINKVPIATNQGFKNIIIKDKGKIDVKFLALMMTMLVEKMDELASGGTFKEISKTNFCTLQIPLPPFSIQQQIVIEIESYQKVIDGAKQVVDNYKPNIRIHPDWPLVVLGEVFKLSSGRGLTQKNIIEGPYNVYGGNGINGKHNEYFLENQTLVIGRVGEYCGAIHITTPKSWVTDNGLYVTNYLMEVNQDYLGAILSQLNLNQYAKVGGQPSISQSTVYELKVPLPPLTDQQAIIHELEMERLLVQGNQQLIARMQQKIKDTIVQVWGAEKSQPMPYMENDMMTMAAEE